MRRRGGYKFAARQGGWVQLIYFVISLIITVLLSPKPVTPKPASIEDFDVPTAEQNRILGVAFGKVEHKDPNVVWYGDLDITKIRKSSLFGGSQTIGYRYFLSMHCVFGYGPCDAMGNFQMGEKSLAEAFYTANQTLLIDLPNLFGGERGGGGFTGKIDLLFGADDQVPNVYLLGLIGPPMPAWRGCASIIVRGFNTATPPYLFSSFGGRGRGAYIGNRETVGAISCQMIRIREGWHDGVVWNTDDAAIGTGMNPAHICYQVLTDPEFSSGTPTGDIDEAFFHDFADRAIEEGLGLNLKWTSGTKIDFLQVVLDHCAGILGYDAQNGFLVQLVRGDYDVEALTRFDESNVEEVTDFERRSWGETVNELTVVYTDATTFKASPITVQDLGNIRSQGVRIPEKIDRSGITDPVVKTVVAGRELASRSTPLARCTMTTNRVGFDKRPGECIILSWAVHELEPTVFRIITMKKGKLGAGKISAQLVEDIYALAGIEYHEVQPALPPSDTPPLSPDPPANGGSVQTSNLLYPPSLTDRVDGERHLIPSTVPGDSEWFGHEGEIAEWDADAEEWIYIEVPPGSIVNDQGSGGHVSVDGYGNVVAAPWTPSIPLLVTYPGTFLDTDDVTFVGYSLADAAFYEIPGDLIGGGGGAALTVTDVDTTAADVAFIGMIDAEVVSLGAGSITIKVSPLTTKGDLYTRTSSGVARLPVGAEGGYLRARSAESTGLKFEAAPPIGEPASGAKAVRTSNQSIATATLTAVTLESEAFDTDTYWAAGAPTRMTALRDGLYQVAGIARWATSSTTLFSYIVKNGDSTNYLAVTSFAGSASDQTAQAVNALVQLVAGDYVELWVYQASGGALDLIGAAGGHRTQLMISKVGATAAPTQIRGATWVRAGGEITVPVNDVYVRMPHAGTIVGVTVTTIGGPGSCVIDIRKDTYANFPPTGVDSICASAKPTLSSASKYEDTTLTGWTTAIAAGDVIAFVLESSGTFSAIFLQLHYKENA